MSKKSLTCSLAFDGFDIDFDLKMQASLYMTQRFERDDPDFVYVVAETWLRIGGSRHMIIPAIRPANMYEELKDLSSCISNPASVPTLEKLIRRGEWSSWRADYWLRFNEDRQEDRDESFYDLLIPLSFSESRAGEIAIYSYDGLPTIEVAIRGKKQWVNQIHVWSGFDPEAMNRQVNDIKNLLVASVRDAFRSLKKGNVGESR